MKKIMISLFMLSMAAPWAIHSALADEMNAAQLRKIEAKQDLILQQLEELKSELQIVKLRVSSR